MLVGGGMAGGEVSPDSPGQDQGLVFTRKLATAIASLSPGLHTGPPARSVGDGEVQA
jgi:hypothetical protein